MNRDQAEQELRDYLAAHRDPQFWFAALWAWVESRLIDLSDCEPKLHQLRKEGREAYLTHHRPSPDFHELTTSLATTGIRFLQEAARALVVLEHCLVGRAPTYANRPIAVPGGDKWIVGTREPWLTELYNGAAEEKASPPGAAESPSMQSLVYRVAAVPSEMDDRGLDWIIPDTVQHDYEINAARSLLAEAKSQRRLRLHMASLGPNCLSGLNTDASSGSFSYLDPDNKGDSDRIAASIFDAVSTAGERHAQILLMPELAVPCALESVMREAIANSACPPAITVAGLRHIPLPPDPTQPSLSGFANEAVAYGPTGLELWRHRKLTDFRFVDKHSGDTFAESTRHGRTVHMFWTPIGTLSIITCLDSFAVTPRKRIEQSFASLLLVPSLSSTVKPHTGALGCLVNALWASAFVCNRHPTEQGEEGGWTAESVQSFAIHARGNAPVREPGLEPRRSTFEFTFSSN